MKKLCPICQKKRTPELFPPRHRQCVLCDIAKKHGQKLARKEESSKTWIKRLDKLIGARVRSRGVCEATGRPHKGILQWAHLCSRRYHSTRWLEENSFCLCAGCHKFYTDRPLEFEAFVISKIGLPELENLKYKALNERNPDYKILYNELNK